jgi:hypothetical protein
MKSGKKLKKSDAAQRAINWFHDSPGAKVSAVAKRFGISIPYAYKLREKAAGKSEADAREWNAALLSNEETTALFDDLKTTDKDPIDDILDSRATDYGTFADNSRLAQALKRAMADHASDHGRTFADDQWEALEMIASKMSRIVNGNPDKVDNWDDIAGYAKLISDRLRGTPR